LIDVRRAKHRPPLRLRRQRNRTGDLRPRLLRRSYDVRRRLVDHRVIEGLEANPNATCHGNIPGYRGQGIGDSEGTRASSPVSPPPYPYFRIFVTTPAPTVR